MKQIKSNNLILYYSSYLRREWKVEPLTNLAFWKRATKEKMFATNIHNQNILKTYLLKVKTVLAQRCIFKIVCPENICQKPLSLMNRLSLNWLWKHVGSPRRPMSIRKGRRRPSRKNTSSISMFHISTFCFVFTFISSSCVENWLQLWLWFIAGWCLA